MDARDSQAFERFLSVEPAWCGIKLARDAIGLDERTILHCGPPATPAHNLVRPTRNSAAVACVYEGWAATLEEGLAQVESGAITFSPAQDYRVATPMAAVVSPSMPLIEMRCLNDPSQVAYAPINGGGTGGDPAPRYGRCSPAALDYLRFLNDEVAPSLPISGGDPIAWLPLMDAALTEGDDGHLRHGAAHARLLAILNERGGNVFEASPAGAFIAKWPFFHLNFWMAAIRCVLGASEGVPGSSLITAMAGNGDHFGLQVSGPGTAMVHRRGHRAAWQGARPF